MDGKAWFKQAKYGMMIHWGLYSMLAGEWKGQRIPFIGEWIQQYYRIPNAQYHALAGAFDPILFDPDEWARVAVDSGMKYMVVTSKHHDGFALFRSRADSFNIVDATPFGRDAIEDIANACARHGLKLGLYYSQELDWSHPHGGGYGRGRTWGGGSAGWTNDWDFPDNAAKDYTVCFEEKIKPQVQELLTGYGPLCLIWFDTPHDISPAQSRELVDMVHHYQPECLVNSRVGNGMGDYSSTGDNQIPDDDKGDMLWECPATLNDTWGYKSFDNNWKDAVRVAQIKRHLNERGINYLLNVGPDALGRFPAPAVQILSRVGKD